MTPVRLDDALLETLLGPGPVYREIIAFVRAQEGMEERFVTDAEQAIDALDFETDVTSEDPDTTVSVKLDAKSQQKAVDLIQGFAKTTCENRVALCENAAESLLNDMTARLGNLPAGLATQAVELKIADGWYDLVQELEAVPQFVYHCLREHDAAWTQWFLSGLGGHRARETLPSSLALQTLGARLRHGGSNAMEHAQAWCQWHMRHGQAQDNPHLHALHLASQLTDADKRMAQMLDQAGFCFDLDRIDWGTLVRQASSLKTDAAIAPKHIEAFLDNHMEALVRLGPQLIGQAPMDDGRTSYLSTVSMNHKPMNLAYLVSLVTAPKARGVLRARLDTLRMEYQTAAAAGRSPKRRL